MKPVTYTRAAVQDLRKHRSDAKRIMDKFDRYAETGAGDVTELVGRPGKRLRIGAFRAIFEETETEITVLRVAPRGEIYE